ncbi:MAG: cytochrome c3 family protein [Candidatus Marinimicrobia bacterium]|nr:cytochrome c3 family protein [Candidatus Neomarinimicrobiota bacterium]MCF7840473.1 cytochrome c3 family protein [Candidatus Neomarinimicrobiota bacterium]
MAQIFPKWTNKLPPVVAAAVVFTLLMVIGLFWWFGSPKYTDVGYQPVQPIPYSHKLHAGDLGMDCRYCHTGAEKSPVAMVPPTQTCMNCHVLVLPESEKLLPVRESWSTGTPIPWVKVHKVPDYAYFDHSAHLRAGVGCASCHGRIDEMEVVYQAETLSMGWCLECHRDPDMSLRPMDQVTNMSWTPPADQREFAVKIKSERNINPPTNCSGCHR